jgi:type IV pilus assembly protein PilW
MVGLLLGMVVLSAVVSVYLTTLKTSSATLKSSRLNQEMGAILNIMANDIRRAGYWENAAANFNAPELNPFTQVDSTTPVNTTALRVHSTSDNGVTFTDRSEEAVLTARVGSCLLYSYDATRDGVLDSSEKFGFRWDGQPTDGLMMRASTSAAPNNCTTNGWNSVTDTGSIEITSLRFSLENSKCMNNSEPDGADEDSDGNIDEFAEYNCYGAAYAPDAGERTLENISVLITLGARLVDDPQVAATMSQSVQVRNYLIRVR